MNVKLEHCLYLFFLFCCYIVAQNYFFLKKPLAYKHNITDRSKGCKWKLMSQIEALKDVICVFPVTKHMDLHFVTQA